MHGKCQGSSHQAPPIKPFGHTPNTLFFQVIMSTLYSKRRYFPWKTKFSQKIPFGVGGTNSYLSPKPARPLPWRRIELDAPREDRQPAPFRRAPGPCTEPRTSPVTTQDLDPQQGLSIFQPSNYGPVAGNKWLPRVPGAHFFSWYDVGPLQKTGLVFAMETQVVQQKYPRKSRYPEKGVTIQKKRREITPSPQF